MGKRKEVFLVSWCNGNSCEYTTTDPSFCDLYPTAKVFFDKEKAEEHAKELNDSMRHTERWKYDFKHGAGMRVYPLPC